LQKVTGKNNNFYKNFKNLKRIEKFLGTVFDEKELQLAKLKRLKEKKCSRILRQILTNGIFLSILLLNCYANKTPHTFNYQNHIKGIFASYQDVIT
jgi:hypothetical protein